MKKSGNQSALVGNIWVPLLDQFFNISINDLFSFRPHNFKFYGKEAPEVAFFPESFRSHTFKFYGKEAVEVAFFPESFSLISRKQDEKETMKVLLVLCFCSVAIKSEELPNSFFRFFVLSFLWKYIASINLIYLIPKTKNFV